VGAVLPEPLAERARLQLARRLESRLRRSQARRGAALVFHSVADREGDPKLELDPPIAADRLERVVDYLADRYELVRASELPAAVSARAAGDPVPLAVTFDDDLSSHATHALRIFVRRGVPATAFLCGPRGPFWWQLLQRAIDERAIAPDELPHADARLVREALERRPRAIGRLAAALERLEPRLRDEVAATLERAAGGDGAMLTSEGVAALLEAGWEMGFHTRRHDLLTNLDEETLRLAVEAGRDAVAGGAAATFAYPHGKATAREAVAVREAGFVAAYTGRSEIVTETSDPYLLGRLQPDTHTVGRFALELARRLA
jgi:peptidoglycan/xylan/chitin deacetylase (PgdA/CDA1 family)